MDADLGEVEQPVEQPDVPIGGAAGADMAEDPRVAARQVLGAERGQGAGAHLGDQGGVEQRHRHAGLRVEEIEQRHLRRQAAAPVLDIVADDLDAGQALRREVAAQHVEMALEGGIGLEMDARLDHRLAEALGPEPGFDGVEDLVVVERQPRDVRPVEIGEVDLAHQPASSASARR